MSVLTAHDCTIPPDKSHVLWLNGLKAQTLGMRQIYVLLIWQQAKRATRFIGQQPSEKTADCISIPPS